MRGAGGEEPRGRRRPVLRRRRRLSPPRAGRRRPHHPALGVPDLLHALPAGDRAGHAAIPLRVPDAGREPHRHGGRQRLHVRRLDRDRRGGADGASRHAAAEGGALRRPASALSRSGRDAVAAWPATRSSRSTPTRAAPRTCSPSIDDDTSCVVVQSPSFFGQLIDLRADRREGARARRAARRRLHRGRVARADRAARRTGRRHRRAARARASATR